MQTGKTFDRNLLFHFLLGYLLLDFSWKRIVSAVIERQIAVMPTF